MGLVEVRSAVVALGVAYQVALEAILPVDQGTDSQAFM